MTETIITEFQHSQDLKSYSDNIVKAGFQKKAENKYLAFYLNKKNNYFKLIQKTGVKKPVWVTLDEYHSFIKQGLITDSMTLSGMTLFENQK